MTKKAANPALETVTTDELVDELDARSESLVLIALLARGVTFPQYVTKSTGSIATQIGLASIVKKKIDALQLEWLSEHDGGHE